ncbi:MAG: metallophosphoesterase [Deltaproteobacteria bacterium]|nr:metallophosphoesterase [Deltaproteobacteria bacterium]
MKKWTRRKVIVNGFRGVVILGAGKGFYNTTPLHMELSDNKIKIDGLPESFRGLKIAQLTDLHASAIVSNKLFSNAARLVMSQKPDLIFLTGDFVSGSTKFLSGHIGEFNRRHFDESIEALSGLKAPLGIYGVLGNHDFWSGPTALETIMTGFEKKLEVKWLRNESVTIEKGGEIIHLLGVDDYWSPGCSLGKAYKGLDNWPVKILLSHNPDINEEIDLLGERIDLVVSGHTHGGQIVAPLIGQPVIPSKYGQKYRAGLVRDGARQTYVSRGIGHLLLPLRLNCPPEVTLIRLV